MAKPRSAPTAKAFEVPEVPDLMPSYDPFAVAKQFDQLRSSFSGGGAAPFQMPTPQPKPVEFGGQLPYQPAAPGKAMPKGKAPVLPKGVAANPSAQPPTAEGHGKPTFNANSEWGRRTTALAQQFPGLRQTSGYRSPEHNARTPGAAKNSLHMQRDSAGNSRANDFVGSTREMQAAAAWAKAQGAREVLQHNAGTGFHLHVGW